MCIPRSSDKIFKVLKAVTHPHHHQRAEEEEEEEEEEERVSNGEKI